MNKLTKEQFEALPLKSSYKFEYQTDHGFNTIVNSRVLEYLYNNYQINYNTNYQYIGEIDSKIDYIIDQFMRDPKDPEILKYLEITCNTVISKSYPSNGPAFTSNGELIRAYAKLGYRLTNDGDDPLVGPYSMINEQLLRSHSPFYLIDEVDVNDDESYMSSIFRGLYVNSERSFKSNVGVSYPNNIWDQLRLAAIITYCGNWTFDGVIDDYMMSFSDYVLRDFFNNKNISGTQLECNNVYDGYYYLNNSNINQPFEFTIDTMEKQISFINNNEVLKINEDNQQSIIEALTDEDCGISMLEIFIEYKKDFDMLNYFKQCQTTGFCYSYPQRDKNRYNKKLEDIYTKYCENHGIDIHEFDNYYFK